MKKKKKATNAPSEFSKEYTVTKALKHGDLFTKLSCLILGLGNIVRKQFIKGLMFLGVEALYIWFMITYGIDCLKALPGLGEVEQIKPEGSPAVFDGLSQRVVTDQSDGSVENIA